MPKSPEGVAIAEDMAPCRKCGGGCTIQTFGPSAHIDKAFDVWICKNSQHLGGSCTAHISLTEADWTERNHPLEVVVSRDPMGEGDLLDRLRTMYAHRWDGRPTQFVNPDGEEAAALIEALQAKVQGLEGEVARLQKLLEGRDNFIVNRGLWSDFVEGLPNTSGEHGKGEG